MNIIEPPKLYKQYFIDKNDERKDLFNKLQTKYSIKKGIYPGSFVHITPSIFIKEMLYIDSDKRINKFFGNENTIAYINFIKEYSNDTKIIMLQEDYTKKLPIKDGYYDIMFSFYSGFISQSCKSYLKQDGILICNNSHGDSSVAILDEDYEFIGVITRKDEKFTLSYNNLDNYFIKKDGSIIDREKVLQTMIGEKFTIDCYAYIFKKLV